MATTPGVDLLAEMVRRRREYLDLSQGDLSSRGGPGVATVSKIERGAQARYSTRTQRQVERALGWGERTVKFLLGEGVPPGLDEDVWAPFLTSLVAGDPPMPTPAVFEDDPWSRTLTQADFQRVGRLVKQARESLGLSHADVRALGGPSVATQRDIESGKQSDYRLSSTWPLERALGWSAGSIQGSLRYATEPRVLYRPNYQALRPAGVDAATEADLLDVLASRIASLKERIHELEAQLQEGGQDAGQAEAKKNRSVIEFPERGSGAQPWAANNTDEEPEPDDD